MLNCSFSLIHNGSKFQYIGRLLYISKKDSSLYTHILHEIGTLALATGSFQPTMFFFFFFFEPQRLLLRFVFWGSTDNSGRPIRVGLDCWIQLYTQIAKKCQQIAECCVLMNNNSTLESSESTYAALLVVVISMFVTSKEPVNPLITVPPSEGEFENVRLFRIVQEVSSIHSLVLFADVPLQLGSMIEPHISRPPPWSLKTNPFLLILEASAES